MKDVVYHETFEDVYGNKFNICTGFDQNRLIAFTSPPIEKTHKEILQIVKRQLHFIQERKQL